jgi:uncharacterized membrane protein YqjE
MADRSGVIHHTDWNEGRSLGEILQDIVRDFQSMLRAELQLARAELAESAQRAGKAGGLFGAAALTGLLGAMCLVTACIAGLALVMPVWAAALIAMFVLLCIAGACYAGARSKLKQVNPAPRQTIDTLKEDVEWAKHRMK